ncbi:MAG: GH3 auxin-responsive promoter family protein [Bacteroidota bacterium]
MMKEQVNKIVRWYLQQRMGRIEKFIKNPHSVQTQVLKDLVAATKHTNWGRQFGYRHIQSAKDFAQQVPISSYDDLKPYIQRMMRGEKDVLWSGQVKWFSKSSGTTSDKSKFIPVTDRNLFSNHIRGNWDTMSMLYQNKPDARVFADKNLLLVGSLTPFDEYPKTTIGDISAIMAHRMPAIGRPFYAPDFKTGLMPEWEEKIERTVQLTKDDKDLYMIAGVPTWNIVLFRRLLEVTGKEHILEVWPKLSVYVHGGVGFAPYKEQFKQFLPKDDFVYMEAYNASEGFFATKQFVGDDDLLLLLNNGVYYEFLPMEEWDSDSPKAISLEAVELGKSYAMLISTNAGLWRYKIGDTVTFTSKYPYKIKITGRTKQFINAFGEEVMVENTDKAVARTCDETRSIVSEYTVAPIYFTKTGKGGHQWLVEFEKAPQNVLDFAKRLDKNLQQINGDYEAKRYKGLALEQLRLSVLPKGTFHNWMRARGKFGVQNKIPRLANHRQYLEEILQMTKENV